jgi:hypothetical protein
MQATPNKVMAASRCKHRQVQQTLSHTIKAMNLVETACAPETS